MADKPKKRKGGRTMSLTHRGVTAVVREGRDRCEIVASNYREVFEGKSFEQTCRAAMKWLLETAGQPKGDYDRE